MSAVESSLIKSWGNKSNLSDFFQGSNSVEHMRIPKVVAFQVAFLEKLKSLFRS